MLEEHEGRMEQAIEDIKKLEEHECCKRNGNDESATFDDDDPCADMKRNRSSKNATFDDDDPCNDLAGLRPSKKVKKDQFVHPGGAPLAPFVALSMLESLMLLDKGIET